jgi:hypothetical protein
MLEKVMKSSVGDGEGSKCRLGLQLFYKKCRELFSQIVSYNKSYKITIPS